MTWIRTYTGLRFDPLDLGSAHYDIRDIAHSLSNLCRYNGHSSQFYSVAQHSVHVAEYVEGLGGDVFAQLAALLHDASEAYLSDVPRPLKMHPSFQFYRDIEQALQEDIYRKFLRTRYVPEDVEEAVELADMAVLAAEARDLMNNPTDWDLSVPPWDRAVVPLPPECAREGFLTKFTSHYATCKELLRWA